jgi:hypothetical protein
VAELTPFRAAAGLVALNLAFFLLSSWLLISGAVSLSHHWLFAFHEALLYAQAWVFKSAHSIRALTVLSLLVFGIAAARLETILMARHTFHLAVALAFGSAVHGRLGVERGAPCRRFNLIFSALCLAAAIGLGVAARR